MIEFLLSPIYILTFEIKCWFIEGNFNIDIKNNFSKAHAIKYLIRYLNVIDLTCLAY